MMRQNDGVSCRLNDDFGAFMAFSFCDYEKMLDGRINGQTNRWPNGRTKGCTNGCISGWTNRWKDGQTDHHIEIQGRISYIYGYI